MPSELLEVIIRQLTEPGELYLPNAEERLGLSGRDFTALTGGRGYLLPAELVEMIHQHWALPDLLFFHPADEGSPSPLAVNSRQEWWTHYGMRAEYDAIDWQGWYDVELLDSWRSGRGRIDG